MVPSLDTADTTLALSTIDESLNTGQRDPRSVSSKRSELADTAGLPLPFESDICS